MRLQFHRIIGWIGAVQGEEIDLADRAPIRAHLRDYVRRQGDLAETFQNALAVPVVVGVVVEDQLQVGESEERERPQMHDVRDAVHHDFERNGDLLFDLLRRNSRPLRDDLDVVIGHVGIGLNGQMMERDDAPGEKQQGEAQMTRAVVEREIDDAANHLLLHRVLQLPGRWRPPRSPGLSPGNNFLHVVREACSR